MPLKTISSFEQELRDIRHQIHSNPELGFQEEGTSALVAEKLEQWGYEVHRGIAKTGVVGVLRNGDSQKSIGIRADMDALPIDEATGKPWSSKKPGVMHACGHDGHTTVLLGAAKYLAETRKFNGTVNLIFQPAEEGAGGGEVMVKEGLFDRFPCDVLFGLHNMPGYPLGHFCFKPGAFMASMDHYRVTVTGRGGHGAMPHLAIDPVVAAASITMALQSIVSRNVKAGEAAVISVGAINAGSAFNIIPNSAVMELSVRALSPDVRKLLDQRIREIVHLQAESFNAEAKIEHVGGTPVTMNAPKETEYAADVARKLFGADKVDYGVEPLMGSEDFAYMLEAKPEGCYFFVGAGEDAISVHNPGYDFNDDILVPSAAMWGALVEDYLK
ncbi:M20 aminoacylase family protein [Microvirga sp. W0021]|uniref:M20 aminoacylase family protein n=1 Tax=Hohaiivirga grylli TaxID=3133970 RepID=A0ABV0BJ03_9HYPH